MSYYVSQFDIGADFQQPHNFVKINGMLPVFHLPLKHYQRPNYTRIFQWINPKELGLSESSFDYLFTEREFQNVSATTVIINVSTAKLTMEFIKNDLSVQSDNSERHQLKPSLLVLDNFYTKKPIRIFNLKNGLGELCIFLVLQFESR